MPRILWTTSELEVLLNHLEANKGENGWYRTKKWAACEDAAESINKAFPNHSMSAQQVLNKFWSLAKRNSPRCNIDELFLNGRNFLKNLKNMASMPDSGSQAILGGEMEVEAPHGSVSRPSALGTTHPGQHPELSSYNGSRSESDGSEYSPDARTQRAAIVRPPLTTDGSTRELQLATYQPHLLPQARFSVAAGPSALLATTPRTSTMPYIGGYRRIQEYLADEAGSHVPCQRDLIDQGSTVLRKMDSAIDWLLGLRGSISVTQTNLNANYERVPRIHEALSDDGFSKLCRRVYGVGTVKELTEKANSCYLYMRDFLRGFLAAAITDWVFDERRVSVPGDLAHKTAISQAYEREVEQLSDKLHEQILRKSRSLFIKNDANFEEQACSLSHYLLDTLKPFLVYNQLVPTGETSVWIDHMKRVFVSSLKLKAQTVLRSGRHKFRCPATDDAFNRKEMTTDGGTDMEGNWVVLVTVFPALVQITEPLTSMDDAKEAIIFPARVVLQ